MELNEGFQANTLDMTDIEDDNKQLYKIVMPKRDWRILTVSDLHLRDEEFSGTENYVGAVESYLLRLITKAEQKEYDILIFLGDVFDRAYENVAKTLYHIYLFDRLNKALNGRVFTLLGNHYGNKKKNQTLKAFLVGGLKCKRVESVWKNLQFSGDYLIENYGLTKPLLHAPDQLEVNGVLFNFFHYNRNDKRYKDESFTLDLKPSTHIGLYHDSIMSEEVRKYINHLSNSSAFRIPTAVTAEETGIFDNVDYAVIGDTHTKIGEFEIVNEKTKHKTNCDIPGSLAITAYHDAQLHNDVNLPHFTIKEDGTCVKSYMNFPLVDFREIYKTKEKQQEKILSEEMKSFKNVLSLLNTKYSLDEILANSKLEPELIDSIKEIIEGKEVILPYKNDLKILKRKLR